MIKSLSLSEVYNNENPFEELAPGNGIVLIGVSYHGPAMLPIKAKSLEQVVRTFGVDSQLTNAYLECKLAGGDEIYLIRINGEHASTTVKGTDGQGKMILTSLDATDDSSGIVYDVVKSGTESFLVIKNRLTGTIYKSYLLNNKTIAEVVSEINIDAITFDVPVCATAVAEGAASIIGSIPYAEQTVGGKTDIRDFGYNNQIKDILSYLNSYPIAQIGILFESFNTQENSYYTYQILSEFTTEKAKVCEPCIVTIGIKKLMAASNIYDLALKFASSLNIECQVSEFINVVLANPKYGATHPDYFSNGVATYCGLIYSLPVSEGTTNQKVYHITEDSVGLTSSEKRQLASMGYVVFIKDEYRPQYSVLKGTNLSKTVSRVINLDYDGSKPVSSDNAPYTRYIPSIMSSTANIKLVQYVGFKLRDLLDSDLGQISDTKVKITQMLSGMKEHIKDFKVEVNDIRQGFTITKVVYVDIFPAGEVESVSLSVQL